MGARVAAEFFGKLGNFYPFVRTTPPDLILRSEVRFWASFVSVCLSLYRIRAYAAMPSFLHEACVSLFQRNSRLAPELLRRLHAPGVSDYSDVRVESANLTDFKPVEYRADHVLLLVRDTGPVLGIIVEIQLRVNKRKEYTWPAYVANLRARIRCPVCLLVIAAKEGVARWARKPIELGGGSRTVQWVMGPVNIPVVDDLEQAKRDIEMAVLSALVHGQSADVQLASRVVTTALATAKDLDPELSSMYFEFVWESAPEKVKELIEMNAVVYEYKGTFARRCIAEGQEKGIAQGKAEGRADVVLRLLTMRFGPLTESAKNLVHNACGERLDNILQGLLIAETLDDALALYNAHNFVGNR